MDKKIKAILIGLLAVITATGAAFGIAAQKRGGNDSTQTVEKQTHRSSLKTQENESEDANEQGETSEENEADEQGEKAETNEADEQGESAEINEADKANETAETNVDERTEAAESARLQSSTKITPEQAKSAALAQVSGTTRTVELENEGGKLVYGVEIKTADGSVREVKVDAGSGQVLRAESDAENDGESD